MEKDNVAIVRLTLATITSNTLVRSGVHLLEIHAPQLVQGVQPGQYCMVRCCDMQAHDPLLRRPFFIHSVQRERGTCTLFVQTLGRGTTWLVRQPPGTELDILGPNGHGWVLRPTVRNLLLVGQEHQIAALTLLAQVALEQEMAVTLINQGSRAEEMYPPALLPAEVEYHVITTEESSQKKGALVDVLGDYIQWADALCCSVSRETVVELYNRYERIRHKHFAQSVVLQPLVCGSGACLACNIETHTGPKLLCRDGPAFDVREIAR